MTLYYLDSSAWRKYYIRETGSEEIAKLFADVSLLACHSIGFLEVVSAIWKKVQAEKVAKEAFQRKIRDVGNDWTQFIQVHSSQRILNLAAQVAITKNLTESQALHLASVMLLQKLNQDAKVSITVVSSDTSILAAAQSQGFITMNPASSVALQQ
jgi:predicted nucleic acid-binding protein